jgi:hypothetical protein
MPRRWLGPQDEYGLGYLLHHLRRLLQPLQPERASITMKTEFVALTPAGTFALLFAGFLIGEVYARSRNVERAEVDEAGINILRNLCRRGAAPFFWGLAHARATVASSMSVVL